MSPIPIHLFNTLTKKKEVFKPNIDGHVSMYHCGPTVYNNVHIGNLRAYVASDVLRRVFELNEYDVSQIMNITDIGHLQHDEIDQGDDKMTLALRREGKELTRENMKELGLRYFDAFREDCAKMNILQANLYPFASDHIDEDISFVQQLLDKGNAYATDDGIYFDTNSLTEYGRLGGISSNDDLAESRIGYDEIVKSKKKNIRDFAIWKFNDLLGFETPFGKGFPGWHIECSVMSMKYLGGADVEWANFKTFDIHTGGIDHIPVHHNNEIAQTEALSGKILANYWLHNAHIIFEGGKKMAKSGEGFITLQSLVEKGLSPLGIRYWMLNASYRAPIVFSIDAITDAERSYRNLVSKIAQIRLQAGVNAPNAQSFSDLDGYIEEHSASLDDAVADNIEKLKTLANDDLNTPKVLAFVYEEIINSSDLSPFHKMHLIKKADTVLGLNLLPASYEYAKTMIENSRIPDEIKELAEKRQVARDQKDWDMSDKLRDEISSHGYEIKDVDGGYTVNKKLI